MLKNFHYGGQAVIEGVMMRGPSSRTVAVRKPDQSIMLNEKPVKSMTSKAPFKWPLIRGVVMLYESLVLGLEALSFSANQALDEEEELSKREIVLTMTTALALAICLFVVVPTGITHYLTRWVQGSMAQNVVEGVIRIAVFGLYVFFISLFKDIKRVFEYHGAEHKVINAYEAGAKLTVENVRPYSTIHSRCGTSFIFIVLMVSIFIFAALGEQTLWWRIGSRILLLPVVAGVSYELLKVSAKMEGSSFFFRLIAAPGKWLQKITTREPDDRQLETAIDALNGLIKK